MNTTLLVGGTQIEVRPATAGDVPLLMAFVRAMAAFEKLACSATEDSLRDALFGPSPAGHALLAFAGGSPVAYVTYFFTFGTMVGKRGLWLDDLFVDPAFRGRGIGRAVMAHLAGIAVHHGCARFEWMVLDWNEPALRFYERLGADVLHDWRICRLEDAQISRLASGS